MINRDDYMLEDKLKEECGVFGIYVHDEDEINSALVSYNALYALQHRGQEGCGIAVNNNGLIHCQKDIGLISEVFDEYRLNALQGNIAVAHVRYSTSGDVSYENTQPLVLRYTKGAMALAHNGNLINALAIRQELEANFALFQTTIDSEIIAFLISKERMYTESVEESISKVMRQIQGAYSVVMMTQNKLIAFRDKMGFRPLCVGKLSKSYVFASESCAFDAIGAEFIRDVKPGEIITVKNGELKSDTTMCTERERICIFEYIYFARPDSIIDGVSVYEARKMAGRLLANQSKVKGDVVIGVPDSGMAAAAGYAEQSGIQYELGLIKNKYIGRTFIQPDQKTREDTVRIKLNVLKPVVKGKKVILVDDSIVRGTTCRSIVKMIREAGATEIHFMVSAPPFKYPCFFGTDIPSSKDLVAWKYAAEQLAIQIGVDTLTYLSIDTLDQLLCGQNIGYCDGCFTKIYPIEVPETMDKMQLTKS